MVPLRSGKIKARLLPVLEGGFDFLKLKAGRRLRSSCSLVSMPVFLSAYVVSSREHPCTSLSRQAFCAVDSQCKPSQDKLVEVKDLRDSIIKSDLIIASFGCRPLCSKAPPGERGSDRTITSLITSDVIFLRAYRVASISSRTCL